MQIFIIANLEVDLVYREKDDSLFKESSFSFGYESKDMFRTINL